MEEDKNNNTKPVAEPTKEDSVVIEENKDTSTKPADENAGGVVNVVDDNNLSIDEKLEKARRAMEGKDRTAERLKEEKEKEIKYLMGEVNRKLSEVSKQKEILELAWIELDEKRKKLKAEVAPIIAEENKLEGEEIITEETEAKSALPETKHGVEEKRWELQQKRHEIEGKKWEIEQKIIQVDKELKENTGKYQKLLDEEDDLQNKLEALQKEITV